jgi:hypothetical protein
VNHDGPSLRRSTVPAEASNRRSPT